MGSVGDFLFGGNKTKSTSQNSSGSSSSSQNQSQNSSSNNSQNSSVQGSLNSSSTHNGSGNSSSAYNLGYGPIAAAMMPTLGMTAAGGNMLGAMLGVPGYSMTGGPKPASGSQYAYKPPAPTASPPAAADTSDTDLLSAIIAAVGGAAAPVTPPPVAPPTTTPAPGPAPAPAPGPPPIPSTPPVPPSTPGMPSPPPLNIAGGPGRVNSKIPYYADGGPIRAGQPAIVGEHQPEVFVPQTNGFIMPQVPGYGPDGRTPPSGSPPMSRSDMLDSWHDQRPDRSAYVGDRDGWREAKNDWRDQRPDFRSSMFGQKMPPSYSSFMSMMPGMMPGMVPGVPGSMGLNPGSMPMNPGMGGPIQGQQFPGRADGGPVTANQPYTVGEHQPEAFIPTGGAPAVPVAPTTQFPTYNHASYFHHQQPPTTMTPPTSLPPMPPVAAPPVAAPPVGTGGDPQQAALDNYFNTAGGKFQMQQGQNAINSDASAGGFLQSGATGKALEQFGQGLASTYMNDYINHLLDFSKLGLGGASAMSGAGSVNTSQGTSYGTGHSVGGSYGNSQGTSTGTSQGTSSGSSTGTSTSTGTGNSSGQAKNGLLPDITGAANAYAAGGGSFK